MNLVWIILNVRIYFTQMHYTLRIYTFTNNYINVVRTLILVLIASLSFKILHFWLVDIYKYGDFTKTSILLYNKYDGVITTFTNSI